MPGNLKTFKLGGVSKAQEDLPSFIQTPANGGTLQIFYLQGSTFCNWQIHAKISAARSKCVRRLNILEFLVGFPLMPEHLETLQNMANPVVGELPEVKHKFPHEYLVRLWLWSKDLKWAAQMRHEQFNNISWCELHM